MLYLVKQDFPVSVIHYGHLGEMTHQAEVKETH